VGRGGEGAARRRVMQRLLRNRRVVEGMEGVGEECRL
jgi:hypothetical protein